jgi:uncharacterized membrane protein HdeD (DUF308 family)
MSIDLGRRPLAAELRHELNALRGNWFWFVLPGVALVVLGTVALGSVVIASLAAAMAIGVLLLLGGAAEAVGAFWCRCWSGFFLELLSGVLSIVVGLGRRSAPGRP